MKHVWFAVLVVLFAMGVHGQQSAQKNKPPSSSSQKADSKSAPTLGFNRAKDISPVIDSDALVEEGEMLKKLPGNEFVKDKRALHEGGLMHGFVEGFTDSKECHGITFYLRKETVPDFAVQITVTFHDQPNHEQEWVWMLSDTRKKELGGLGTQSSAKLTARDVCLTVWDDVDPNHLKKPGGKIE
jgi:hypothetical protein